MTVSLIDPHLSLFLGMGMKKNEEIKKIEKLRMVSRLSVLIKRIFKKNGDKTSLYSQLFRSSSFGYVDTLTFLNTMQFLNTSYPSLSSAFDLKH